MADERFLVTGSEGCIGSWVVHTLVDRGVPVVATDVAPAPRRLARLLEPDALEALPYAAADLTAAGAVDGLVAEHGITRIVHLAALQVPFVRADPVRGAEVNVVGTARVLEAARQAETVRGLVYASSSAAYGADGTWGRADTLYGVLKGTNEEQARFYARDYATPSIGLRPCVVYGPNRDQGMTAAITHALKAVALGVPYEIPFSGAIDLQYTADVAAAFVAAALAEQDAAPVYDLHGDLVDVAAIIAAVEQAAPEAAGTLSSGDASIPGRVEFDDAPLQEAVGALPHTPLADGIAASLERFRRQVADGVLTVASFEADAGLAPRPR